ncbi:MAG: HEAT repeat domain-containing protein [Planctomycetes bacterium]|nr:HEAT repeat domain-containing protein [Planctomycetota bacterium]
MRPMLDVMEVLRTEFRRGWYTESPVPAEVERALALRSAASDDDRCEALRLLGRSPDPRAVAALLDALRADASAHVRQVAALSLCDLVDRPGVTRALAERVADVAVDPALRAAAAWSLRGTRDGPALATLTAIVQDFGEVPELRELAARALLEPREVPPLAVHAAAAPAWEALSARTRAALIELGPWLSAPIEAVDRGIQRVVEALLEGMAGLRLVPTLGQAPARGLRETVLVEYFPGWLDRENLGTEFHLRETRPLSIVRTPDDGRAIRIELDPASEPVATEGTFAQFLAANPDLGSCKCVVTFRFGSEREHLPAEATVDDRSRAVVFEVRGRAGSVPTVSAVADGEEVTYSVRIFAPDTRAFWSRHPEHGGRG